MAARAPDTFIALQRFGLGARPGDLAAIASDPRGAVLAEIDPATALINDPSLPDTITALTTIRTIQMERQAAKLAAPGSPPAAAAAPSMAEADPSMDAAQTGGPACSTRPRQKVSTTTRQPGWRRTP